MNWKILLPCLGACLLVACASDKAQYSHRKPVEISREALANYWVQKKPLFNFSREKTELPAGPVKGYVEIRYLIDASGKPRDPKIVASEPAGVLEPSALATLAKTQYRAAESNPEAIPVYVTSRFDIEIN